MENNLLFNMSNSLLQGCQRLFELAQSLSLKLGDADG